MCESTEIKQEPLFILRFPTALMHKTCDELGDTVNELRSLADFIEMLNLDAHEVDDKGEFIPCEDEDVKTEQEEAFSREDVDKIVDAAQKQAIETTVTHCMKAINEAKEEIVHLRNRIEKIKAQL